MDMDEYFSEEAMDHIKAVMETLRGRGLDPAHALDVLVKGVTVTLPSLFTREGKPYDGEKVREIADMMFDDMRNNLSIVIEFHEDRLNGDGNGPKP